MAKIYLSAAAHAADRSTDCGVPYACSENTHCKEYMDLLEKRLNELGFEVRRGYQDETGDAALDHRISDANNWKADLYYIAHTNAGGGKYSMTMCYSDEYSQGLAGILSDYRKSAYDGNHKVVVNTALREIKNTSMVALYDELYFHDDPEMNRWFHTGGMEKMVEETCQAFCNIFDVAYLEDHKWYKVQVGAFRNREYAEAMRDELVSKGYDAFIKEE